MLNHHQFLIFNRRFIAVLGFVLGALLLSGCQQTAYTGLAQRQVNAMLAVLRDNGVDAYKQHVAGNQYSLTVEDDQLAHAIDVLRDHGYPKKHYASMADIFKKSGLLSSPLEERARYIYALSQSISNTLSDIDGVVSVHVNLVVPKNNPFADGVKPSSAAVFLKYRPDYDLKSIKSDIKLIVQKSIQGLDYSKITVVMLPARSLSHMQHDRVPVTGGGLPWWVGGLGLLCLLAVGGWYLARYWRRRPPSKEAVSQLLRRPLTARPSAESGSTT